MHAHRPQVYLETHLSNWKCCRDLHKTRPLESASSDPLLLNFFSFRFLWLCSLGRKTVRFHRFIGQLLFLTWTASRHATFLSHFDGSFYHKDFICRCIIVQSLVLRLCTPRSQGLPLVIIVFGLVHPNFILHGSDIKICFAVRGVGSNSNTKMTNHIPKYIIYII